MLEENVAVRHHCLHCDTVLTKKGRKFCNRDCYNASRKVGDKTPAKKVVEAPIKGFVTTKAPVKASAVNNSLAFEKALVNMNYFKSPLTLHRLKKLVSIAGERALVIRVAGGLAIHWHIVGSECYIIYYAPGRCVTYKACDVQGLKNSIQKLGKHKLCKDALNIKEYIELAEQMKGGE